MQSQTVEGTRQINEDPRKADVVFGVKPLAETKIAAVPTLQPFEELKFSSEKERRINQGETYDHILKELGKRGFLVDVRPSADGRHIDLLTSTVRAGLFSFLAMPEWSDRTDGMAQGGYKRDLSFVRVYSTDVNDYQIIGGVTINAYKNFSAALTSNGEGFVVNVDKHTASRGLITIYSADGRKERLVRASQISGSPRDYQMDSVRISDLDYDSTGNLWGRFKPSYQDSRWEKIPA